MKLRPTKGLAWAVFSITAALVLAGEVLAVLNVSTARGDWGTRWGPVVWEVAFFSFPCVGVLIASRRPDHAVAWVCLGGGLFAAVYLFAGSYATYGLRTNPDSLPGAELMAWLEGWTYPLALVPFAVFLPLVFPDGRLLSPRWRWVAWVSAVAVVAGCSSLAFAPGPLDDYREVSNPVGLEQAEGVLDILAVTLGLLPLCVLAATASMVRRFRRARGEERLQLKWFASAVVLGSLAYLLALAVRGAAREWSGPFEDATFGATAALALAVGIAVLRYRLYDIDVVISKALVVGVLGAFVTAVYVAIVVGLGALIGGVGEPNIVLSILATAVVAVAFEPARERARHFANRIVYGKRATPYEVLAEFSERVAETYATEDVLPKMARTVAEGTGAERADVWLRSGDELRLAASWPNEHGGGNRLTLSDGRLPAFGSVDRAVAVRHQNELLGALTVVKPSAEPLTPTEDKLLTDLAAQAGLVLRNVGLTSELLARLDELAASRQRLVTAQDEERRRLERNLHDGAQQHLVALKVKLNLAARLAPDGSRLRDALDGLQSVADEAIEALRDLARGIYPPLLADEGLAAALRAQARKATIPVEIAANDLSRYPQDVESAVYFCCLEALQNVAKYAGPSKVVVRLTDERGSLRFRVEDDGEGFDPAASPRGSGLQNMADRIEALGGRFELRSAPGEGTTVVGELPTEPVAPRTA
jgi:signal transduction histidine kinase